jgi:hypothetical protein
MIVFDHGVVMARAVAVVNRSRRRRHDDDDDNEKGPTTPT